MGRRRSYFRVLCGVTTDFDTPDQLWCFVSLLEHWHGRWMTEGWTAKRAEHLELGPSPLISITGRRQLPAALRLLSIVVGKCATCRMEVVLKSSTSDPEVVGKSTSSQVEVVRLFWPKLAEIQGWNDRDRAQSMTTSAPAPAPAPSPAQKEEEEPPKPPKGVPACWPLIVEAFAAYGKEVRTCGAARLRAVRARAREFGEASVVEVVHGYMALHRRRDDERFDPMQYLTPETIYRPSHFAKYLDAYRAATAAGETPPFTGGHDPYAAAAADFRARRHRATH